MTVTLLASDVASPGSLSLTATNPTPGGGTSSAISIPVNYPAPGAITISPATVGAGTTTPTTVTVTGTNFVGASVVQVNGSARPTTFVSATQVTFQLTVADQASTGSASVAVVNPTPGGGTSPAASLSIVTPALTPVIASVTPTQVVINTASTLLVQGTNLVPTSVVLWNGSALQTTYKTYTAGSTTIAYLNAAVPASLPTALGTASITVSTPGAPAVSNAVTVSITNPPVPTITSISPNGVPLNTATPVTITGTGFNQSSTVIFDSVAIPATFVSSTSLTVNVASSALVLPGNHAITVNTPAPGGGTSNAVAFTAYIGLPNNAMAMNPVNGLLYVSVPSSAGPPYGNSVVSVDPATGAIGTPILVGSEPDKLAISSDGTTLWVGLDGASAVRKVNLTTGVAGMQFSLGGNAGLYEFPPLVHAIAVLPGAPNSIVVSSANNGYLYDDQLVIYDNGVARTNKITISTLSTVPAIFVNPVKAEVYATSTYSGYQILSYDANGLTHLAGNSGDSVYSGNSGTAVQIDAGRAYLDSGVALDAEAGTLLGTFYSTGTTVAVGPMVSDSSVGKNFVLLGTNIYSSSTQPAPLTVEAFNESDFTPIPSSVTAVSGALAGTKYGAGDSSNTSLNGPNGINTLMRWGSNGLVFRAANGVFSFRSNMVKDLSGTASDLGVSISAPASAATGAQFTVTSTVTNGGPSGATSVAFTESIPANTNLVSVVSSKGSCTVASPVTCSLGSLANGSNAVVTLTLQAMTPGTATVTAAANASESDAAGANNTASATVTLSGNSYAAVPVLSSLAPNNAQAGSADVTLKVNGSGFVSGSIVYWGSTALNTSFVSSNQMTAYLPSTMLTTVGWSPVTVSSPAPGGGASNPLEFSIYGLVKLAANHLAYDPYGRQLFASVNSTATEVTGNTIVTIDPVSGAFGTPYSAGSQPTKLAFSDDGNILYIAQTGANSVGRFNMATMNLDFSFPVSGGASYSSDAPNVRDLAVVPGTENILAVDMGSWIGTGLYDVNPSAKTATSRAGAYGQSTTGPYNGSSLQFLNPATLFTFDIDTSGQTFDEWTVTPTGLSGSYTTEYTLNSFSAFKIRNALAYADAGGVADPTVTPVAPVGVFLTAGTQASSYYSTYGQISEPDTSLGKSFFANYTSASPNGSSAAGITLRTFDQKNYLLTDSMFIPTPSGSSYTFTDFLRVGQDGLALLRSDGMIMLLKGAFVVPQLLTQHAAATITAVSSTSVAHGSGNTVLTVTGSGFVPGAGVMWNGAYRTTTIVDGTHLSVAIPASDLANAGSASITTVNPGASASNALTITIN